METGVATPVEAHVETPGQQESTPAATRDATPVLNEIEAYRELVRLEEQLKSAQDRVKSLEELADFHRQSPRDAEWRYQEILAELRQCQQNLAAVTRALPAPRDGQDEPSSNENRRSRPWWPFGRR